MRAFAFSPWIRSYASRQSVAVVETIDFMVSSNPPARFKIDVFRSGYIEGAARARDDPRAVRRPPQPDPPVCERACANAAGTRCFAEIPATGLSALVLGRLTPLPGKSDQTVRAELRGLHGALTARRHPLPLAGTMPCS